MTNRNASITIDATVIRTKLVNLYARMVAEGKVSEAEARQVIAEYDAGTRTVRYEDLPLEPGEIVAPTIGELLGRMRGDG